MLIKAASLIKSKIYKKKGGHDKQLYNVKQCFPVTRAATPNDEGGSGEQVKSTHCLFDIPKARLSRII